jgi:hypothetical protein
MASETDHDEHEHERDHEHEHEAVDIASIDIFPLLGIFINILSEQAWQFMGLRVRPATQKIEKDLDRARTAIDCVAFMIDKIEPQLSDVEKLKMRGLLTDLQINFIRQQG